MCNVSEIWEFLDLLKFSNFSKFWESLEFCVKLVMWDWWVEIRASRRFLLIFLFFTGVVAPESVEKLRFAGLYINSLPLQHRSIRVILNTWGEIHLSVLCKLEFLITLLSLRSHLSVSFIFFRS